MPRICIPLVAILLFQFGYVSAAEVPVIAKGKTIKLHYSLTVGGEVVDGTAGGDPVKYVQGEAGLLPGLQRALEGHKAGDKIQVDLAAAEGFGPVNPAAQTEVPKNQLPPVELKPGLQLNAQTPDGKQLTAVIKEVRENTVVMDFNHPLAGKDLHFDIEVVEIS
jgi:FKBP-type peptidyl-prolyl cis-trans isomerase 2